MRNLSAGLLALSLLGVTCVGCADDEPAARRRRSVPVQEETTKEGTPVTRTTASAFSVNGHVAFDTAATVDVMALANDGTLVPVATTNVKNGTFAAPLEVETSATGIFIMKVKDVTGAVLGAGVVNGAAAFVQAFVIDATVDAATSFKTEILVTIAKKGVPGVQNYLNVLDAYVDAQLANSIALVGVLATDINTLIGTVSDAVIAAENVIVEMLEKAGITVDLTALQAAQSAAVSGVQGLVTSATGQLVTNGKNLVAALQAATARAAAPVDEAIFNAVVNGGAAFGAAFKKKSVAPSITFAATKSVFSLESGLTSSAILDRFTQSADSQAVVLAVTKACTAFLASIQGAANVGDLEAAKALLTDALLGKNGDIVQNITDAIRATIESTFAPLTKDLLAAFATLDPDRIAAALAAFDVSALALPAKLQASLTQKDAANVASALNLVRKQVVQ